MFSRLPALIARFLLSPLALLLVALLAFVLNAASLPLSDVDEGAFTEATREMLARGNLVSPTLNDAPRHDKPILIYWVQAASVSLLGQSEFAFRLPSIIASLLWLLAIYRFAQRHIDRQTGQVAALVMALSLAVGFIAKAAISDALLNLFIALSMFGVFDYFAAERDRLPPTALRRILYGVYALLGLGFLTKGPVAVMFPLLISAVFFALSGAWRAWFRAVFFWPGWLLFLAIVVPWHVLVFLDQGDAFFRGFYLKHNLNRYSNTFEGHGGRWYYYLIVLPFMMMPFTGWLLVCAGRLRAVMRGPVSSQRLLDRYLIAWFVVVFVFFSLSGTQLPHYLLYGCTPLFILLARHRPEFDSRWLAYLPLVAFAIVIGALPQLLAVAAESTTRAYERMLLDALALAFGDAARWWLPAFAVASLALLAWRRLPVWQGLILAGMLQAVLIVMVVAPRALDVLQGPVREAAQFARQHTASIVAWRIIQPSFSVYRQAATPTRLPVAGEWVLTRTDRMHEVQQRLGPALVMRPVFQKHFVTLAAVEAAALRGPTSPASAALPAAYDVKDRLTE